MPRIVWRHCSSHPLLLSLALLLLVIQQVRLG